MYDNTFKVRLRGRHRGFFITDRFDFQSWSHKPLTKQLQLDKFVRYATKLHCRTQCRGYMHPGEHSSWCRFVGTRVSIQHNQKSSVYLYEALCSERPSFFIYTDGAHLNTMTRGNIDDQPETVGSIRSEYWNSSGPSSRL